MKNDVPVVLTIKGSIVDSYDDHESVELETEGFAYEDNGYTCFSYVESPMSGMEGTSSVIKVKNDLVEIIRIGTVNSIMEFETGKKNVTLYSTPYGEISLEIKTEAIEIERKENRITRVKISYTIGASGAVHSNNTMDVHIKYN